MVKNTALITCFLLGAVLSQALPVSTLCNRGCTACNYSINGNFCSFCAGSQLLGNTCIGSPATPNCIYHNGNGICQYCESGYTHALDNTCKVARKNTNNALMRNCAFSYTDGSGVDGCNGCLPGFTMNANYVCESGSADPNCLVHGFRRSDSFKTRMCIQCYNGFFINGLGICSALPSHLTGCAVPDQTLNNCFWCDGYHGYSETNVTPQGYKTCTSGGENFYQKSLKVSRTNQLRNYSLANSILSLIAIGLLAVY